MENSPLARIKPLLQQLQQGIYEKNTETSLALLAALAGESILLLGPPGVAKSMVARRLKLAFQDARSFEYLMSRFSTPDEIFGPVSIARLKENDKYERTTEGYLPTADVVFLDEIWKAGPAIQNTLLTVMNERVFRNGDQEMRLPLKLLVAASNELPAKGEGLEALWDRFIIRLVCRCIQDEHVFQQMLNEVDSPIQTPNEENKAEISPINAEEYTLWQTEARKVKLAPALLKAISQIRSRLQHVELEEGELARRIYVSDRRWVHIARLLRTSAYLQGRAEATVTDLLPMYHCLWNEPDELPTMRKLTLQVIFDSIAKSIEKLATKVKGQLRARQAQSARSKTRNTAVEASLPLFENTSYETETEQICNEISRLQCELEMNLFVSDGDRTLVAKHVQQLYQQVALCRVDIRKLLYNDK